MKYYGVEHYGNALAHRAKYGTADSTSNEKGTDNKKNNTSKYNHDYYVKNKEKWGVRQEYTKGDKDFDDDKYNDHDKIDGTDFHLRKREDGSYVLLLEDTKWNIPDGADIEALKKQIAEASKIEDVQARSNKYDQIAAQFKKEGEGDFDIDAAARDVIRGKYKNGAERRAALGEDYEMVQKRVNELMKQQNSGGSKETKSSSSGSSKSTGNAWKDASSKYFANKASAAKTINADTERGKKRTEAEKKKKK